MKRGRLPSVQSLRNLFPRARLYMLALTMAAGGALLSPDGIATATSAATVAQASKKDKATKAKATSAKAKAGANKAQAPAKAGPAKTKQDKAKAQRSGKAAGGKATGKGAGKAKAAAVEASPTKGKNTARPSKAGTGLRAKKGRDTPETPARVRPGPRSNVEVSSSTTSTGPWFFTFIAFVLLCVGAFVYLKRKRTQQDGAVDRGDEAQSSSHFGSLHAESTRTGTSHAGSAHTGSLHTGSLHGRSKADFSSGSSDIDLSSKKTSGSKPLDQTATKPPRRTKGKEPAA